mgnify:CR=1 FL=1
MEPLAVDLREAARLLGVSRFTVRRWIKRGSLRSMSLCRRVLIPLSSLRDLIENAPQRRSRDGADGPSCAVGDGVQDGK